LSAQLVHPPAKIDQHGEKDCEDAGQPKCSGLPKEKPTRCDCNRCNRATRSWQGVDLDRRLISRLNELRCILCSEMDPVLPTRSLNVCERLIDEWLNKPLSAPRIQDDPLSWSGTLDSAFDRSEFDRTPRIGKRDFLELNWATLVTPHIATAEQDCNQ